MGTTSQKQCQQNVIHIEFLTASQKHKKEQILQKMQKANKQQEEDDVIMVPDYTKYYNVDYRQTIYTTDEEIMYKNIVKLIISPNADTPTHLLKLCSFYTTQVKSYQIFFNNQEFAKNEQSFNFGYEPLFVEVIYQPKHWAERFYGGLKDMSFKFTRAVSMLSRVASVAIPLYTAINTIGPFVMPALATAQHGLMVTSNPKAKQAQSAIGVLIGLISKAQILSYPILKLLGKYIPYSKTMAMSAGLYMGRGMIWNSLRLVLTVLFPFLSPIMMLIG